MLRTGPGVKGHAAREDAVREVDHGRADAEGKPVEILVAEAAEPACLRQGDAELDQQIRAARVRFLGCKANESQVAPIELADM